MGAFAPFSSPHRDPRPRQLMTPDHDPDEDPGRERAHDQQEVEDRESLETRTIGAWPADVFLHVADVEPRQEQAQEQEQPACRRDDVSQPETLEVHGRDHIGGAEPMRTRPTRAIRSQCDVDPGCRPARNDRVGSATDVLVPPSAMSDQPPARVERDGPWPRSSSSSAGPGMTARRHPRRMATARRPTQGAIAARLEEVRARTLLLIEEPLRGSPQPGARPAHEPDRVGPGPHRHLRGPVAGAEPVRATAVARRPRRRVRPVHGAARRARRAALPAQRRRPAPHGERCASARSTCWTARPRRGGRPPARGRVRVRDGPAPRAAALRDDPPDAPDHDHGALRAARAARASPRPTRSRARWLWCPRGRSRWARPRAASHTTTSARVTRATWPRS